MIGSGRGCERSATGGTPRTEDAGAPIDRLAKRVKRHLRGLLIVFGRHFTAFLRAFFGIIQAAVRVGNRPVLARIRGLWAARSADIEAVVLAAVEGGDVVRIKGSAGSRMDSVVSALNNRSPYAASSVRPQAAVTGALQL
jgi:UDP-N-acetylmuramyl pentapeptide synthase